MEISFLLYVIFDVFFKSCSGNNGIHLFTTFFAPLFNVWEKLVQRLLRYFAISHFSDFLAWLGNGIGDSTRTWCCYRLHMLVLLLRLWLGLRFVFHKNPPLLITSIICTMIEYKYRHYNNKRGEKKGFLYRILFRIIKRNNYSIRIAWIKNKGNFFLLFLLPSSRFLL